MPPKKKDVTEPTVTDTSNYEAIKEEDYPVIETPEEAKTFAVPRYFNDTLLEQPQQQNELTVLAPLDANESWFKTYWRPAIAWQYFAVCLFDFIIGPAGQMLLSYYSGQAYVQWSPLTLQATGFYHIAMAAIIGIAAWTKGVQEKNTQTTLF